MGESTMEEIARSMQVSPAAVYKWVRKYKTDIQPQPSPTGKQEVQDLGKDSDKAKQKEIEELKLKVAGLEMMIDIAEKELKIDIRKSLAPNSNRHERGICNGKALSAYANCLVGPDMPIMIRTGI